MQKEENPEITKPTELEIKSAADLLEEFSPKNGLPLLNRIMQHELKVGLTVITWKNEIWSPQQKLRGVAVNAHGYGITNVSIGHRVKMLKAIKGEKNLKGIQESSPLKPASIAKAIEECQETLELAQEFLNYTGVHGESDSEKNKGSIRSQWFFFFLYIRSDIDTAKPMLGRAKLLVYENNYAEFKNLPIPDSVDYKGQWHEIKDNVQYFDLAHRDENGSVKRALHFKVYCKEKYHILFGAYTTFDSEKIYSGSLILQRIEDTKIENPDQEAGESESSTEEMGSLESQKSPRDEGDPHLFDFLDKSKKHPAVHDVIWNFFAEKNKNYFLVPKPAISIEDFDVNRKKKGRQMFPARVRRERWFIEREKQRLYIASPQTGLDQNGRTKENQSLVNKLLKKIHDELNVDAFQNEITAESKEDADSFDSLFKLRTTRFFVLILDDTSVASYAVVQLGWALSHCQHIIVFFKEGAVSGRFKALESLDVKFVEYHDLRKEWEGHIFVNIQAFIKKRNKVLT